MNIFSVISLLVVLALLYVFFSTGKGESYNPVQRETPALATLDESLNKMEAAFTDIKPKTEKKIIWFGDKNTQTDLSLVYLHGFSASRQEVTPLTENIAQQLGANIFLTRLTGHGRSGEAMAVITVEALLSDAIEALEIGKQIGKRVIVIGMSTGATLAAWLAAYDQSTQLAGVVLLSPNFGLKDPKAQWLLKPAAKIWLPLAEGRDYQFTPENDAQAKFWSWKYPTVALIPMMKLVSYVSDLPFQQVKTPLLVLYSPDDELVDLQQTKKIYQRFGSKNKQIEAINNTQGKQHHVLAGDILSPQSTAKVEAHILAFLIENAP